MKASGKPFSVVKASVKRSNEMTFGSKGERRTDWTHLDLVAERQPSVLPWKEDVKERMLY